MRKVSLCAHLFALGAPQILQAVGAGLLSDGRQQLRLDGAQGVAFPAGQALPAPRLHPRHRARPASGLASLSAEKRCISHNLSEQCHHTQMLQLCAVVLRPAEPQSKEADAGLEAGA